MIGPASKRVIAVTALILGFTLAGGCASKGGSKDVDGVNNESSTDGKATPPETPEPSGPSLLAAGKAVNNFSVSLNSEAMDAGVSKVAEDYEVALRLNEELNTKDSLKEGGNLDVEVTVRGMRLKTNQAAIWAGIMAGPDWINVEVNVKENGAVVKNFQVTSVTTLGGFGYGGRSKRVARMVKDLGNKVIAGI